MIARKRFKIKEDKVMGMNGFVRSRRSAGVYCMKRHINPGQKVSLDELYEQYGISHDIPSGPEFVRWLRTVKLGRRDTWEIMYNDAAIVSGDEPFEAIRKAEEARIAIEDAKREALRKAEEERAAIEAAKKEEEPEVKVEEVRVEEVEKPNTEETAEIKEPEVEKVKEVAEVEVPEKKLAGKVNLEGDIKVDDSGGMSFSFPSGKENAPDKSSEKVNDVTKFTKIKASGGSIKAVRARNDGTEKPSITPSDILEMKVNDFEKIDKVNDLRILKIALKKAEDMRNKATLCKHLKTRIGRLKPRSRFGSV